MVKEWSRLRTSNTLGPNISKDGYNLVDVKTRIALANEAFNKRKEFLTKGGLSRTLKKRMVKVLVWLRDMDAEKRGNKQIGGTGNVAVEKVGKN